MVAAGISLMIAAGNSAGYGTIGTPGAAKDVITVGATEDSKDLAVYSSKGPTHEGQIKPNVAAIGSAVMSVEANSGNGYASYSGTSMATPMVAGMAVLLLQANPDLQPLMIRTILESTSEFKWLSHPVRPNNDYGWGFVLMDAALEELDKLQAIAQAPDADKYRVGATPASAVLRLAAFGLEGEILMSQGDLPGAIKAFRTGIEIEDKNN